MKEKSKLAYVLYLIGVVVLIIGAIDPLEGSVLILVGSALITFSTHKTQDRHWKIFATTFLMIVIGVFFLFYFSSLGGFGEHSALSWWCGTLVLPYPIGWLTSIITLIVRAFKKPKQ